MKTVEEYLRHARECDVLARKATLPEQREMIAHMANTWRILARQRRTIILRDTVPRQRETPESGEPLLLAQSGQPE